MPYRRTENVVRRLAARREAILAAARAAAAEGGMSAVQIAPVAERAGVAAGTVYRYFPGKADLVIEVLASHSAREVEAIRKAADSAPGPLSALAAAVVTYAARMLHGRKLAWAMLGEPIDADLAPARLEFRQRLVAEFAQRITSAMAQNLLPEQDAVLSASLIVGAAMEGLIGPIAKDAGDGLAARATVQAVTLFILRALGVNDARARGMVVQTALPVEKTT